MNTKDVEDTCKTCLRWLQQLNGQYGVVMLQQITCIQKYMLFVLDCRMEMVLEEICT